ncbi:MAG: hypothetical protein J0L57_15105 [Burkholderiales bacterium]|nr:hypothetical protein [Burkholderiales bacterium]
MALSTLDAEPPALDGAAAAGPFARPAPRGDRRSPAGTDLRALAPTAPVLGVAEAVQAVRAGGRSVLTFGGFGELGYDDEARVLDRCRAELDRHDPARTLVATGTLVTEGFRTGIAMVYVLAWARGFATVGIHPSVALHHPKRHTIAAGVDRVLFVDDPTWGGTDEAGRPSNTLRVLLAVSDAFIVFGGGHHTAQELRAFLAAGKAVRFHDAPMHRATTERWCRASGVRIADYRGAAYHVWRRARAEAGSVPAAGRRRG